MHYFQIKSIIIVNLLLVVNKMATRHAEAIDDDLKNIVFETSEEVEVTPTFDELGLKQELLRGIYSFGIMSFL